MRVDKLLWFLRLAKTRTMAQLLVNQGHIRMNGHRVERAHHSVSVGDVLVIPLGKAVRIIRLVMLPMRRGPAAEAQACYQVLDAGHEFPIAGTQTNSAAEGDLQP